MPNPIDYGTAVITFITDTIHRYWFRYWALRILHTLSLTEWRTFDEVIAESGCRVDWAKEILLVCMLANAIEYQANQVLNYQNADVIERAYQTLEAANEIDIIEFLEFRLKKASGRKRESRSWFTREPELVPTTA